MNKKLDLDKLLKDAVRVLKMNDEGNYTVPSRKLYPHQWAWDSAFSAIGWSFVDPKRGIAEIERLISFQWEDGRIPHIIFNPEYSHYFPGPDLWKSGDTSSITQPPVISTALKYLLNAGIDKKRIANLIPSIEKYHEFFRKNRDPESRNLVSVAHPWESGMDNSPSWDQPLDNVKEIDGLSYIRKDISDSTLVIQRPTNHQYKKYISLVLQMIENDYKPSQFNVYDPFMTTILAKAELDLGDVSELLDVRTDALDRGKSYIKALKKHLFDKKSKGFISFDVLAGTTIKSESISSIAPYIILKDFRELPNSLKEIYLSDYGLRSNSNLTDSYDPDCYWRGPVWMNINWLFKDFLSYDQEITILENIDRVGFYEYFNPEKGKGLGSNNFSWTAALTIETIHRLRDKK